MNKPLHIRVTDEHIEHGKAQDCFACPIALAVNEALGEPYGAKVYASGITIHRRSEYGRFIVYARSGALTPVAVEFMKRFDEHLPVEPFEFNLFLYTEADDVITR